MNTVRLTYQGMFKRILITGFPNYEISMVGSIYNVNTGYRMKPTGGGKELLRVALRKNGKSYTRLVGRLVAREFLTGFDERYEIRYKDGDYSNVRLGNLAMTNKIKRSTRKTDG